jgi:hypothetical protein
VGFLFSLVFAFFFPSVFVGFFFFPFFSFSWWLDIDIAHEAFQWSTCCNILYYTILFSIYIPKRASEYTVAGRIFIHLFKQASEQTNKQTVISLHYYPELCDDDDFLGVRKF